MSKSLFPETRMRRNRSDKFIRNLVRENVVSVDDVIYPVFILPGKNNSEDISSMPGIQRLSVDLILPVLEDLYKKGLNAVAIFPVVDSSEKSEGAEEAYNSNGLVQETIKIIKKEIPELGIISDVALDPYTTSGQDGIIDKNGNVLNDETIQVLAKQALSHAESGADIVAPSDMMDGRILKIRETLESNNFTNTKILSYAAKYASNLYGPFRDAVNSKNSLKGASKDTYQMDFANTEEARNEVELDVEEGADIVMVKPGLHYLDVISKIKNKFNIPVFAYHVSGEYSMIKAAANSGYLDEKKVVLETMTCFKRSGANAVLTYFAKDIINWIG